MHFIILCYEARMSLHENVSCFSPVLHSLRLGRKRVPDWPRAVGAPSELVLEVTGEGDGEGDAGFGSHSHVLLGMERSPGRATGTLGSPRVNGPMLLRSTPWDASVTMWREGHGFMLRCRDQTPSLRGQMAAPHKAESPQA